MPKPVREIAGSVNKVDLATGKEVHERMTWKVMPPPPSHCQICAVKHGADEAHNVQSLYYQMVFNGMVGRPPTWADAVAHCSPAVQAAWKRELQRMGAWTEPPAGEAPVAHHGVGG